MRSAIQIHNVAATVPLTVGITLFMSDGTPAPLPPITLAARSDVNVDLASAVSRAAAALGSHRSDYGSAELSYTLDSPGHLVASIEVRGEGFGYSEPFYTATELESPPHLDPVRARTPTGKSLLAEMQAAVAARNAPKAVTPRLLDAPWRRLNAADRGWMALVNTSDAPMSAVWQMSDASGSIPASPTALTLPAHACSLVDLGGRLAGLHSGGALSGGIQVDFEGAPGALIATGGIVGAAGQYSNDIRFAQRPRALAAPASTVEISATGLRTGPAPAFFGLAAGAQLRPYLVLRNASDAALSVTLAAFVQRAEAPPLALPAQSIQIAPGTLTSAEFRLPTSAAPELVSFAATFHGHRGDLEILAGSETQDGTAAFQAEVQGIGPFLKFDLPYWSILDGSKTTFTFWNPTAAGEGLLVRFDGAAAEGTYYLPLSLGPNEARQIDVAALAASNPVDRDGTPFPPAGLGSAGV
ncbi:MAG: hypothetical protein ACRD1E_07700, partial [Terriglobales bacterium]